jgi:hypothetical protein
LDISTLQGSDERSVANGLRSNALGVEKSVSRLMPRVRAPKDPERVFGEDPKLVRVAIPVSYLDAVAVAEIKISIAKEKSTCAKAS